MMSYMMLMNDNVNVLVLMVMNDIMNVDVMM